MGNNVVFENVANSSKLHVRISDIKLSMEMDLTMTGLYIIPLSAGAVNMTGLTLDLELTPYDENDGVRW